jgi:hypothetical protein
VYARPGHARGGRGYGDRDAAADHRDDLVGQFGRQLRLGSDPARVRSALVAALEGVAPTRLTFHGQLRAEAHPTILRRPSARVFSGFFREMGQADFVAVKQNCVIAK